MPGTREWRVPHTWRNSAELAGRQAQDQPPVTQRGHVQREALTPTSLALHGETLQADFQQFVCIGGWDIPIQHFNNARLTLHGVLALHGLQHRVAAALHGHVEVGEDAGVPQRRSQRLEGGEGERWWCKRPRPGAWGMARCVAPRRSGRASPACNAPICVRCPFQMLQHAGQDYNREGS